MYSVGFYDEAPENDKAKDVEIRSRRAGLRTVHPTAYAHSSAKAKRESLLRAAYLSPELFQTGVVRAHVFPLRPTAAESWEGLLAVSFAVPLAGSGGRATEREFGAVLRNGSVVVHRFHRKIRLEPDDAEVTSEPLVTFLEPVNLPPGKYSVTAVLADPVTVDPHSAKVQIEVPEIPRRDLFLVRPVLGRRSGTDLVVRSGGSSPTTGAGPVGGDTIGDLNSFQPLLVQQVDTPTDLFALTQACVVGRQTKDRPSSVARSLRTADGVALGTFEPVAIRLEGRDKIRCQSLLDLLPSRSVKRGGEYLYGVSFEPQPAAGAETNDVRFSVGAREGPR